MRALVTGATGKVGNAIARTLNQRGMRVRAMVRQPDRAAELLPAGIEISQGDVTLPETLPRSLAGCELVFNAVGIPEQWLPHPEQFIAVNAEGTHALLEAAAEAGVRRFIHVSTIDVFDADQNGRLTESRLATAPARTAYQRSKRQAEEHVLRNGDRIETVIINPAAVYGIGPVRPRSIEADLLIPLAQGKLPALPPGAMSVVFTESLAEGALLAAEKGAPGERYILADGHISLRDFARIAVQHLGRRRLPPTLPVPVAKLIAATTEKAARISGVPPLIASGQLTFLLEHKIADASKARNGLGWQPISVEEGVRLSVEALKQQTQAVRSRQKGLFPKRTEPSPEADPST